MPIHTYPNIPEDELSDFVTASGGTLLGKTAQEEPNDRDDRGVRLYTVRLEFND